MAYKNDLSNKKKDELFPIKLEEQHFCCPLCKHPFEPSIFWEQSTDFDHLNRNEKDHRPENLAVVHKECNYIKKWYGEYQVRAMDWHAHLLTLIPKSSSLRASECESVRATKSESEEITHAQPHTETHADAEELTDGQINLIINKLTVNQLESELPKGSTKQISASQMRSDIHYLLTQETKGRGSEPSVRRALDGMTKSVYSPWEQKKLGKGNIIIQRRQKIQTKKKLPEIQEISKEKNP